MWENNKRGSSFVMERFRTTRYLLSQDLSNSVIFFYLSSTYRDLKHEKHFKIVILPTMGQSLTSELRGKDRI